VGQTRIKAASIRAEKPPQGFGGLGVDERRARILIVDDDEQVLMALERVLEGEGYCTTTAWSGQEALLLLGKSEFDLLLIDEDLPGLESGSLSQDLQQARPDAIRLLMRPLSTSPGSGSPEVHASVCKWELNQIATTIRDCLRTNSTAGPSPRGASHGSDSANA
jgi:CheY-like chemotaxis protein